jgi:flagellar hook protein FlgE
MMRSMQSAVTGLRAQQTAMDTIGNNIANVNTAGFKASMANFSDLFYQTLNGGNEMVNPSQVGYGSQVSTISKNMTSVGATTTDNATDLYLDGQGYFAVNSKADGTGQSAYTRVGNFHFTPNGYLVDNSTQNFVMSSLKDAAGNYTAARLDNVSLVDSATTPPTVTPINATNFGQLSNISINSDGSISATLKDASGKVQFQTGYAPADATADAIKLAADTAAGKAAANAISADQTAKDKDALKVTADANKVTADADKVTADVLAVTTPTALNISAAATADTTAATADAVAATADSVAAAADAAAQTADAAKTAADTAKSVADFADTVEGNPDNYTLEQIQLSVFLNPDGLTEAGNNCLMANDSSGAPNVTTSGSGNSTVIRSGELEMSNVDLAKEFTNMIVTERGFQANSRVITVSDSMLQELVDLKRS